MSEEGQNKTDGFYDSWAAFNAWTRLGQESGRGRPTATYPSDICKKRLDGARARCRKSENETVTRKAICMCVLHSCDSLGVMVQVPSVLARNR